MTSEGAKKFQAKETHRKRVGTNWETFADADLFERCLTRGIPALMIPTAYNTGFQILQIPGYVVIVYEMFDTRFIPLDGRPHLDKSVGQLIGDSRGRWDGNTLVVETTNFSEKTDGTLKSNGGSPYTEPTSFRGTGANLRVVERWTRSDAGTINYEATVEDPTYWTKPWKMVVELGSRRQVRDVRICMPRRELRHGEQSQRGAGPRSGSTKVATGRMGRSSVRQFAGHTQWPFDRNGECQ